MLIKLIFQKKVIIQATKTQKKASIYVRDLLKRKSYDFRKL